MPCTHYPTVKNILPLLFRLTVFIYLFCFLVEPRGTQDLSALAKDKSHSPVVEAQRLNHWTTWEVSLELSF